VRQRIMPKGGGDGGMTSADRDLMQIEHHIADRV
jgi:hypothetical protein